MAHKHTTSDSENEIHDIVCIGFGPASLAIAVALEDWIESSGLGQPGHAARPKVAFLERQATFNWHIGMLLQAAKMQISFIKDLATARDPGSRFTFLNYLQEHGRLREFARLNTFLPTRVEFADYMKWAAGHFAENVKYDHEVVQILPIKQHQKVSHFEVQARKRSTGEITQLHAKHVVIGIGGSPSIPPMFQVRQDWIIHSSQYQTTIDQILPSREKAYNIAVIGSGQSAAEVFDDLSTRLPNSHTTLIFRDSALRPSDDSPFVNEVFDPSAIDTFFHKPHLDRQTTVQRNRATNYSVVRMELIEKIYKDLYLQDIQVPDPSRHKRRILPGTEITSIESSPRGGSTLSLYNRFTNASQSYHFDAIVLATGYTRKAHLSMLQPCIDLIPSSSSSSSSSSDAATTWQVNRNYSLSLNRDLVESDTGIWLQGCNEETHGLSDSLLSVLANRGGELVESIFGRGSCEAKATKMEEGAVMAML